ncbi:MAG TPA: NUDIX hydrolase, partial [Rubrivivax sp.]|nr:NUDIX hydrolase [Rubrivivax sp.]
VVQGLIAHRRRRGAKVVEALQRSGGGTLEELLPAVYDDVPRALYPVARRSLLAHLIELRDDALATEQGDRWRLLTPAPSASDRPAAAGAA